MNVIGCHNVIEHKVQSVSSPPSSGFERFERSEAIERLERYGTGFNVGAWSALVRGPGRRWRAGDGVKSLPLAEEIFLSRLAPPLTLFAF
jgi:hypothetical protein